ncbi:MAG: hypothetical protein ACI4I9_01205 [Porcipelethomonas sp.]
MKTILLIIFLGLFMGNSYGDARINDDTDYVIYDETVRTQTMVQEIRNPDRPEILFAEITADCSGNIRDKVTVEDVYGVNSYAAETAGLIGVPLEISYNEDVSNITLKIGYDENELRWIPERNIIVLYNRGISVDEINGFSLDQDGNTVSVPVTSEGIYMLDDIYQWNKTWGRSTAGYEYETDKTDFISDWEREGNTGDIMKIADKNWAIENAPYFYVSTPQQLAGAVYYANTSADEKIFIYLENDIDLNGYRWASMGSRKTNNNSFHIEGRGHTISNMCIVSDGREVGFIGYADILEVSDLIFDKAYVQGEDSTGILCGVSYKMNEIVNVSASGMIETDGDCCGALVGDESGMTFTNCNCDVKVNGADYPYMSSREKRSSSAEADEVFTIESDQDCRISRDEVKGYHGLGWEIYKNGVYVLQRNAENETVLDMNSIDVIKPRTGDKYKIYLSAWDDNAGTYVRVSNILEFTVS